MKYELQHRLIRKLINMKAQTLLKAKKYTGILPFLSGICWGATGIFVRTLENAGVDNFTIISCRMLLAALITGICMLIYNRSLFHVNLKDLWLFIASGMIGMTALSIFYNISVSNSSLALAAVLLAMCPVFVLFLAAIFFHEKITGRKTGCVILALTGCVLVSGVFEKGGLAWSVRGIVCGLLACFFYASYSLVSKRMTQKNYHFLTITFYGTLFSRTVHASIFKYAYYPCFMHTGLFLLYRCHVCTCADLLCPSVCAFLAFHALYGNRQSFHPRIQ